MASLAASTISTSLGKSEMLGNSRSVAAPSTSFKTMALFQKKKAAAPAKISVAPADDELAKWYGEWFSSVLLLATCII